MAHPEIATVRRSLLERVLDVVREIGGGADLHDTLQRITVAVVDALDFGAAAINVVTAEGDICVEAVTGPPGVEVLLGAKSPLQAWLDILDKAQPWGELRFLGHEHDQSGFDHIASWDPPAGPISGPDGWHPLDSLFVPLRSGGELIGVLSVDLPTSGRRPDQEQRTVLELFAVQAATVLAEATARAFAEAERREVDRHWQVAFAHSPIGAALVHPDGHILQFNDSLVRMFGYPRTTLATMTFAELIHPDDVAAHGDLLAQFIHDGGDTIQIERRYRHADGHAVWALLHAAVVRDRVGPIKEVVVQMNDITDRKRAEERLAHRASHDPLTNMPNRALVGERLATCLAGLRPAGVLFCDLDRFKTVNDSLGHAAGDELLVAVSRRLRRVLEPHITVGRVGGDEFVVVVPEVEDQATLRELAERVMSAFDRPLSVRGHQHTIGISIGAAVTAAYHTHPDEVLREADQALLRAKRQGRARVEMYDPSQDRPASVEDLRLERALREALAGGRGLIPYFQPIIDLAHGGTAGCEALIRWQHPQRGMLEPAEFLPLAEQTGLIVPFGWWMLEASARAAVGSIGAGWVAVNVSGSQLGRGQLVHAVQKALTVSGLPARALHIEITETALAEASPAAVAEVRGVADLGVAVALDDFGTGFSSLTLLRDLPVSAVKIDRSFIAPIRTDQRSADIVRNLVAMCRDLGMATIAEGVETADQLDLVRALGCTHAQGYVLGTPAPLTKSAARDRSLPAIR